MGGSLPLNSRAALLDPLEESDPICGGGTRVSAWPEWGQGKQQWSGRAAAAETEAAPEVFRHRQGGHSSNTEEQPRCMCALPGTLSSWWL